MFRIGLPEIIIIVLVVLIFVNPREFPGFLRKVGALFKQIKDMRDSFTRGMNELDAELRGSASSGAAADAKGSSPGTTIYTQAGPVLLHRSIVTEVPTSAPVVLHLLIHTGIGDRVNFQAVVRHAMESNGAATRVVVVTYDAGDGYSVKAYTPQPHELWTLPQPSDPTELETILASAVKTLGATYFPQAASVTVIDYRDRPEGPGTDPSICYRELYAYYTDTLAPLGIYPSFPVDPAVLRSMKAQLTERVGELGSRPVVALHLRRRADMPEKNPRRGDMLELARRLQSLGFILVTFAEPGPPDPELEALASFTCPLDPAFQHPATLLSLCSVFVGGDSGPGHLAAAVGTPVVSLRRPCGRWVNGPFCPENRLIPVQGTVVDNGGRKELAFDVDAALAGVVRLIARPADS